MRRLFTITRLTLLVTLTVLQFACQKEGDPNPGDAVNGCKLIHTDETQKIYGNRYTEEMEYNDHGYIIKKVNRDLSWSQIDEIRTTTYEYNTKNQLIRENYIYNGYNGGYRTFDYKLSGVVRMMSSYNSRNELEYIETLTYDSRNRVIESVSRKDESSQLLMRYTYAYTPDDNVSRISIYYADGELERFTDYENYDNKPNPAFAKKGLIMIGESKNNPGSSKSYYMSRGLDGELKEVLEGETTYHYKYNSRGFVTEVVKSWTDTPNEVKTVLTYADCD